MKIIEKLFLLFFVCLCFYLGSRENHNIYNEKITYYDCFDNRTQTTLLPITNQQYTLLKKNAYPKHLTCTKAKYTRYYVKLLKGGYRKQK